MGRAVARGGDRNNARTFGGLATGKRGRRGAGAVRLRADGQGAARADGQLSSTFDPPIGTASRDPGRQERRAAKRSHPIRDDGRTVRARFRSLRRTAS